MTHPKVALLPRLGTLCVLFLLLVTVCARSPRPSPPTITPGASPTTSTALPFPVQASPTASPTWTAAPTDQRPVFSFADLAHLQIIAQWSTGAVESQYRWSPDGARLLMISKPVTRLIDLQTFGQLWEAPGGMDGGFSKDGSRVSIQNGDSSQVYLAADGRPDRSGQPFSAAALDSMIQPVKSFTEGFDPNSARRFNQSTVFGLAMSIQEDGTHRELRFFYPNEPCPTRVYTDLPPGVTGFSVSPDNRLILITAQGAGVERNDQALILGLNSGFETPLPARIQDPTPPGFHPTRPNLGITQRLPLRYAPFGGCTFFPSPIDPPAGPLESYRLKPWDDEAGLAMLKPLVQYATGSDVYGPANGRGALFRAQEPLRTASLEYLLRFPQSSHRVLAQWRLAMTNTILDNNETDGWIAAQIEQALNQYGLALEPLSLNAALAPFGFYVDAIPFPPGKTPGWAETTCDLNALPPGPLLVDNLFGDGRKSQILIVKTVGSLVGMVTAVHQNASGQYRVIPVAGQWGLYEGMNQEIDVVDVTGDSQPEIRVDFHWHNGSMNGSDTAFYQWQGENFSEGEFIEITGGIDFGIDGHMPEIEILGPPGAPKTIKAQKHGLLSFDTVETFQWDGERFTSSAHIPPAMLDEGSQEVYLRALSYGQYEEVIQQLRSLPADPWRSFLLGYVEALQFHPGRARAALQPLADQAMTDPNHELAKAASAFLAVYQDGTDLYRACQAAHQASQDVPCATDLAFQSLLEHSGSQPVRDLPERLEGLGVRLGNPIGQDFNSDGRDDWLLVDDSPLSEILLPYLDPPVWLALSNANGFELLQLDRPQRSETSSPEFELTPFPSQGEVVGDTPHAFLLKQGDAARFFRVRQESGKWVIDHLIDVRYMSACQILEEDRSLVIFHNTPYFSLPEVIRWNPATETFVKTDYLEHLLLVEGRADKALQMIPDLLDWVNANPGQGGYNRAMYGSRLQYLLGLAYELSGDSENAARTYYNLWKSHPMPMPETAYDEQPDQPYAIIAREKLEPIE